MNLKRPQQIINKPTRSNFEATPCSHSRPSLTEPLQGLFVNSGSLWIWCPARPVACRLRCGYVMPEVGNECNFQLSLLLLLFRLLLLLLSLSLALSFCPCQLLLWHCLCYYKPERRSKVLWYIYTFCFSCSSSCLNGFPASGRQCKLVTWSVFKVDSRCKNKTGNFNFPGNRLQFDCQKCKAFHLHWLIDRTQKKPEKRERNTMEIKSAASWEVTKATPMWIDVLD